MLQDWLSRIPAAEHEAVLAAAADELAADDQPTGAAVAPYLRGRQSPEPDPEARAGRPPADWTRQRQARAVVEGICYQARWMVEAQPAPEAPQRVAVIAGSRLPALWTALKSATLPWPVALVRAAEPVATGAAVLALARSGALGAPADAVRTAPALDAETPAPPGRDLHAEACAAFVRSVRAALPAPDGSSGRSAAVD
jgi:xylulokinase